MCSHLSLETANFWCFCLKDYLSDRFILHCVAAVTCHRESVKLQISLHLQSQDANVQQTTESLTSVATVTNRG